MVGAVLHPDTLASTKKAALSIENLVILVQLAIIIVLSAILAVIVESVDLIVEVIVEHNGGGRGLDWRLSGRRVGLDAYCAYEPLEAGCALLAALG